jgi:hypothetical protein
VTRQGKLYFRTENPEFSVLQLEPLLKYYPFTHHLGCSILTGGDEIC